MTKEEWDIVIVDLLDTFSQTKANESEEIWIVKFTGAVILFLVESNEGKERKIYIEIIVNGSYLLNVL